jgi:hypothetical protein
MSSQTIILRGSLHFPKRPGHYVQNVIDSIRSWFRGELILSTWHDQIPEARNLIGLDGIVASPDPGDGPLQQMQRQLNSYWAGVNAAHGEQILVTRTDILHFQNLFDLMELEAESQWQQQSRHNLGIFRHKLIVGNMMTINPNSTERIRTFRVCDWFQCGYREDIQKWAYITEELAQIPVSELQQSWNHEGICTEKLWQVLVLKKHCAKLSGLDWRNTSDYDHLAWNVLVDNFRVLDQISTCKSINLNWAFQPQRLECYVTETEWKKQYQNLTAQK